MAVILLGTAPPQAEKRYEVENNVTNYWRQIWLLINSELGSSGSRSGLNC